MFNFNFKLFLLTHYKPENFKFSKQIVQSLFIASSMQLCQFLFFKCIQKLHFLQWNLYKKKNQVIIILYNIYTYIYLLQYIYILKYIIFFNSKILFYNLHLFILSSDTNITLFTVKNINFVIIRVYSTNIAKIFAKINLTLFTSF